MFDWILSIILPADEFVKLIFLHYHNCLFNYSLVYSLIVPCIIYIKGSIRGLECVFAMAS